MRIKKNLLAIAYKTIIVIIIYMSCCHFTKTLRGRLICYDVTLRHNITLL